MVPSEEADMTARDMSGTSFDMVDGEAIQTHLLLVA
jgi:hypothetical protein